MRTELALLVLGTGCWTARLSAGGHAATGGDHGIDATLGLGVGGSKHQRGGYVVGEVGGAGDDVERAVIDARLEYLDHTSLPWSVALRVGDRFAEKDMTLPSRGFVGVGAAVFPVHIDPPPPDDDDDPPTVSNDKDDGDDMLSSMFPPKPTEHLTQRFLDVGVELDLDAVQEAGIMVGLDLVVRWDTMDRDDR